MLSRPIRSLAAGLAFSVSVGVALPLDARESPGLRDAPGGLQELQAADVRRVQTLLRQLGYDAGAADGRLTPATLAAIRQFQAASGLPVGGQLNDVTVAALEATIELRALVERLHDSRTADQMTARRALEGRPQTRALLSAPEPPEPADPRACGLRLEPACLLQRASSLTLTLAPGPRRDWVLREIAEAWSRTGAFDAARAAIAAVDDPRLQLAGLREVAAVLAAASHVDAATRIAEALPASRERNETWLDIGMALAKQADRAAVTVLLDRLDGAMGEEPAQRVASLTRMAAIAATAGIADRTASLLSRAGQAAATLPAGFPRDRATHSLAATYADVGDLAGAVRLSADIGDPELRTASRALIATAAAGAGDIALAHRLLAEGGDGAAWSLVRIRIAAAQGAAGVPDRARVTLAETRAGLTAIARDYLRATVASELTLAHLAMAERAGGGPDLVDAVTLADAIDDDRLQAAALWRLTDACARLCDRARTAALRQAAEDATERIADPVAQVWVLSDLAEHRARDGDRAAARAAIDHGHSVTLAIASPWARARAMARLATAMIFVHADVTAAGNAPANGERLSPPPTVR